YELESSAVLRDGTYRLLGGPIRQPRFDVQCHRDLRTRLAGEVRDHLFGNTAGVAPDTCRIEGDGAMKTPRKALDSGFRAWGARLHSFVRSIWSREFAVGGPGLRRLGI